jgi:hypothetical protein
VKNTKKQQAEFFKGARSVLIELGAKDLMVDYGYNLVIETSIGGLFLRVDDDNKIMFSVYANFKDNPDKAKDIFGSWKQNVHSIENVQDAIAEVKYFYSRILNKVKL